MQPANDYGVFQRQHAAGILAQVFGPEWLALGAAERYLVSIDFLDAANENVSAREYACLIGVGNLASYGRTMVARANSARAWSEVQS